MNVTQITNLNQYITMSAKQNNLRGGISYDNPKIKRDVYVSAPRRQESDEERGKKLRAIAGKMQAGKKLSPVEMEYLRENAPEWYAKAKQIEKEREEYRRALENSKTKDEARLLHTQKMSQIQTEVKAASANKYSEKEIPFIMMKAAAMVNESVDFTSSDKYGELPNEHEIVAEMIEKQKKENDSAKEGNLEFDSEEFDEVLRGFEMEKTNLPLYPDNEKTDREEKVAPEKNEADKDFSLPATEKSFAKSDITQQSSVKPKSLLPKT
jgi:hypothetical protein